MRADHMPLGDNDQPVGVDAYAHRSVRKAGRHGIAVAIESDQAGRRYALSLFDKAIKHRGQGHQRRLLCLQNVNNTARKRAMCRLRPQQLATIFQPFIQCSKVWEDRSDLPEAMSGITHALLNLTLLPARRRIAELRIEDVVAGHGQ